MKATLPATKKGLPPRKDALIRYRCSSSLRNRLIRIAAVRELDLSDVVREACVNYASQFEHRIA